MGVATTTPARTLLDLAGVLPRHQPQQALNEAEIQRLSGPHALLDRRLTAAGWRVVRLTWRDLDDPGALAEELRALGL